MCPKSGGENLSFFQGAPDSLGVLGGGLGVQRASLNSSSAKGSNPMRDDSWEDARRWPAAANSGVLIQNILWKIQILTILNIFEEKIYPAIFVSLQLTLTKHY